MASAATATTPTPTSRQRTGPRESSAAAASAGSSSSSSRSSGSGSSESLKVQGETSRGTDEARRRSPSTSSSSSPHDPNRQPSASILANAHEATPRAQIKAARTTRSALKAAFIPAQPGKQIKNNGKPLGKSFERKVPLPRDLKIQGGQVLDHDPRGDDASAGDGVVLASPTSEDGPAAAALSSGSNTSSPPASPGELSSSYGGGSFSWGEAGSVAASSTSTLQSSSEEDGAPVGHHRHRTDTMSTDISSASSSTTNSCSIRFAPLPVSGRLKRANSITIGVAARSQLLHSQGSGRNSGFSSHPPFPHQQYQHLPQRHHPQQGGGGGASKPDDVIDLGEEISKRAKKAWLKMKGGKVTSPSQEEPPPDVRSAVSAKVAGGDDTPRPSSPVAQGAGGGAKEAKPSMDTIRDGSTNEPLRQQQPRGADDGGTATPRATNASHDADQLHHHLSRRLSTGAFLGNASLRGMQEERRRAMVGDGEDDGDESALANGHVEGRRGEEYASPAKPTKSSRIVEPHHNPEEEEFGGGSDSGANDDDDDDDDYDDAEEIAEAERLAEASMNRSKENKAAGVEVVR